MTQTLGATKKSVDFVAISKPQSFLNKTPRANNVILYQHANGQYFIGRGLVKSRLYKNINDIPVREIVWIDQQIKLN